MKRKYRFSFTYIYAGSSYMYILQVQVYTRFNYITGNKKKFKNLEIRNIKK